MKKKWKLYHIDWKMKDQICGLQIHYPQIFSKIIEYFLLWFLDKKTKREAQKKIYLEDICNGNYTSMELWWMGRTGIHDDESEEMGSDGHLGCGGGKV